MMSNLPIPRQTHMIKKFQGGFLSATREKQVENTTASLKLL